MVFKSPNQSIEVYKGHIFKHGWMRDMLVCNKSLSPQHVLLFDLTKLTNFVEVAKGFDKHALHKLVVDLSQLGPSRLHSV